MPTEFLHGAEVVEISDGTRPIRTVRTGIIGLVGTAPMGPINVPTLIAGSRLKAVETFGQGAGTIPDALEAIFAQTGAVVVVVNVFDPATHVTAVAAEIQAVAGGAAQLDHSPVTVAVVMNRTDPAGAPNAYDQALVEDTDYELDAATGAITRIATSARLLDADSISVMYSYSDPAAVTAANVTGGVDATTGAYSGVSALLGAKSALGFTPKILIAPGFSDDKTVADALISVADRIRAMTPIEGPATTDEAAQLYRDGFGSRRAYVVDPDVLVADADGNPANAPNSAFVAGVIAKSDAQRGFWWSPSNRVILGIVGTGRPIDFALGDSTSRANLLNENEVATIIRERGYRLWGNRTCSADAKYAFLSVVRTADAINDSILRAHLWAVGRGISRTYFDDVTGSVNAYLRELMGLGAILGGKCYVTPELNTKESLAGGRVYFDFDFTPPPPAERVTFRSRLTNDYLEDILIVPEADEAEEEEAA